ncbi:type III secretion system translocon subunit SctE [Pseudomonas sp. PCH199]|uniref:type III secretion system translocon subunit SctE n=1 Tax=unclassified Pseudomonas TaxID=196821 RepID=UPI000BD0AC25|nr:MULTISPECIES: type III secretion system translocon subunit SctE [unclassified Pseudomonas]MCW8277092.1 type III secretion system translocon subunit SctE [Pseudomonas sp. PCH199]PAM82590.1 cell invasion protein SipB [Pseudomonas sp. ERMR1:02]
MSEIRSTFNPVFQGALSRTEAFEKYGKAAAQAARTADHQKAGQEALAHLMSVNFEGQHGPSTGDAGRPVLYAPPPRADGNKQETNGDLFTLLMAMISELIGEVDVNKLKNRLAMLQSMAGAKQQGHEKLAAEYAAAVEALEAAEGAIGSSQEHLDQLQERVQHCQGLLDASEARLAGLDPDSPEYARELALRDQLKGELAGHTQTLQKATDTHLKLIETANASAKVLAAVAVKVQEAGLGGSSIKESNEKALSSSALALLNRLKIIEMLGEAAQNKEELSQELFQELQAKLQEHMKLESEKYLEEVRKAEALQKTMGCIGAIVGAILTVATIVAGVLTANPVLIAVGVIGAAIMISDAVVKEATGTSFMAEAMKPLTTVMQEAIKLFTDLYTRLLIAVGVDEETAKDIAQIAGMIQGIASTIAAVALVAVVGVQVIGPVISAVASKLAAVIAQAAPVAVQALKQMASSFSNMFTLILTQLRSFLTHGADPVTLARYAANLEIAQVATEFGNVAVQGGLQIRSGAHQAQAAVHLADVRVRMAISEEITSYLTRLVEDYGQAMQDRTRQIEQVFADMQRSHNVSLQIVRHV